MNNKSELTNNDKSTMNNGSKTNSRFPLKPITEVHLNLNISELYVNGKNECFVFKFDLLTSEAFHSMQNANKTSESIITQNFRKNQSQTIINNIIEPDILLKIDKSFVPEASNMFMLDTKKMSYVMNPKNIDEIRDFIKEEAVKKIRREPTKKESDYSSSASNSESDSYSQSNEESVSDKNTNIKKKINDDYYMVNLASIKLLVYDFKKESLIEVIDTNKISQVEEKRNEDHRKKEFIEEKSAKEKNDISGIKEKTETEDGESESLCKEGILIKQIEYALSKEENQPTITRMKWISFLVFATIIALASLFLALFLKSLGSIIENINLIYYSSTLIINTVYSIFHTRELILLNNPKYTNIYQDRSDYIKNNTNSLLNLFAVSHQLLTNIITTSLTISTENDAILNNSTITTYILEDDLNIKPIELTLSSSFIETNTALYHLAHQGINDIYPTSKDVYFFIYNSINSIYSTLFKHCAIFISELVLNIDAIKYNFLYIFISSLVFIFISYFLISYSYSAVGKRKESYLEVFFEIGDGVIKNSLEKCEKFTKKFQNDNVSEEVSNLDEAEMINDQSMLGVQNLKVSRFSSHHKKRKNNNSQEDKIVKIKLILGLFSVVLFFFLMYYFYQNYLSYIGIYINIYDNVNNQQAYYLVIFNILREYFFDKKTFVLETNVENYMKTAMDDIYKIKIQRDNVNFLLIFLLLKCFIF